MTYPTQPPTAQRRLTRRPRCLRRQSQRHSASSETRGSPSPTAQRPARAPETPLRAAPHCVQRYTPRCTAPAASSCHCVLRNVPSKLTSTNQRISRTRHHFAPLHSSTHTHARDFSHRATKTSSLTCHARFPPPAMQNHAQPRSRSHSPRRPRETHAACTDPLACHAKAHARQPRWLSFPTPARETFAQPRQNARFNRPAASSPTPTCIRSPTPTRRNASPRYSAAHALPRSSMAATRKGHPHARSKHAELQRSITTKKETQQRRHRDEATTTRATRCENNLRPCSRPRRSALQVAGNFSETGWTDVPVQWQTQE